MRDVFCGHVLHRRINFIFMEAGIFWISYDLSFGADYTGLYAWLDTVNAKECGDSLATFHMEYDGDPIEKIKSGIEQFFKPTDRDRIYLVYMDEETQKHKGRFLYGRRKSSPWEGYAPQGNEIDEDVA